MKISDLIKQKGKKEKAVEMGGAGLKEEGKDFDPFKPVSTGELPKEDIDHQYERKMSIQ